MVHKQSNKGKGGGAEKTPELTVKIKRKFRVNEGSTIAQSSSRKTIIIPEEEVPSPTYKPPTRKTRSAKEEQVPISPPNSSREKIK
jgi:hypothetical protein